MQKQTGFLFICSIPRPNCMTCSSLFTAQKIATRLGGQRFIETSPVMDYFNNAMEKQGTYPYPHLPTSFHTIKIGYLYRNLWNLSNSSDNIQSVGELISEILDVVANGSFPIESKYIRTYMLRSILSLAVKNSVVKSALMNLISAPKGEFFEADVAFIIGYLINKSVDSDRDTSNDPKNLLAYELINELIVHFSPARRVNILGYLTGLLASTKERDFQKIITILGKDIPEKIFNEFTCYYAWKCILRKRNKAQEYAEWAVKIGNTWSVQKNMSRFLHWSSLQYAEDNESEIEKNIKNISENAKLAATPSINKFDDLSHFYSVLQLVDFLFDPEIKKDVNPEMVIDSISTLFSKGELTNEEYVLLTTLSQMKPNLKFLSSVNHAKTITERSQYETDDGDLFEELSLWESTSMFIRKPRIAYGKVKSECEDFEKKPPLPNDIWKVPYHMLWKAKLGFYHVYTGRISVNEKENSVIKL